MFQAVQVFQIPTIANRAVKNPNQTRRLEERCRNQKFSQQIRPDIGRIQGRIDRGKSKIFNANCLKSDRQSGQKIAAFWLDFSYNKTTIHV